MGFAGAIGGTKPFDEPVGNPANSLGDLMLKGLTGPDGNGRTALCLIAQIIDMPEKCFSFPEMPFHSFRQVGPGRSHIEVKTLPKENHPQASHGQGPVFGKLQDQDIIPSVLCFPGNEVPGNGQLPYLRVQHHIFPPIHGNGLEGQILLQIKKGPGKVNIRMVIGEEKTCMGPMNQEEDNTRGSLPGESGKLC